MKKKQLAQKQLTSIEDIVEILSALLVIDGYTVQNMVTMRLHCNYRLAKLFGDLTSANPDYPEVPLVGLVEVLNFMYRDTGKRIVPKFNTSGVLKEFQLIKA